MKTRIPAIVLGLIGIPALVAAQSPVNSSEVKNAADEVREAATVVKKMQSQPEAARLLDQAKGVFLVPDYGRAAFGVGGSGGQGVLLARHNGQWSDPVFYNIGSISLGLQAGADAGQVAMLLMTDKAVNSFKGNNTFSLNADADLTIVNYSASNQANVGKGDVVFWTDLEGAFAGGSLGASAITTDEEANYAYYASEKADPSAILNGTVNASHPEVATLKQALNG